MSRKITGTQPALRGEHLAHQPREHRSQIEAKSSWCRAWPRSWPLRLAPTRPARAPWSGSGSRTCPAPPPPRRDRTDVRAGQPGPADLCHRGVEQPGPRLEPLRLPRAHGRRRSVRRRTSAKACRDRTQFHWQVSMTDVSEIAGRRRDRGRYLVGGKPNTANSSGSRKTVIAAIPPSRAVNTCSAWAANTPSAPRR